MSTVNSSYQDFEKPLVRVVRFSHGDHPFLPALSVYFQGCDAYPKCLGCHNPETWDFDETFAVDYILLQTRVIEKLSLLLKVNEKVALVLLGGEPLSKRNRFWAISLARDVKQTFGDAVTVLVYSWRTLDDLANEGVDISYFDEMVLGRYEKNLHTEGFPASSNQVYLKMKELNKTPIF